MNKIITNNEAFKNYNKWRHTQFNNGMNVIDIDQVEIRNNQPVAIIETTMFKYKHAIKPHLVTVLNRARFQLEIQQYIADMLHLPLLLVIHTEDLSYFLVYHYQDEIYNEMNQEEYKQFINGLGKEGVV